MEDIEYLDEYKDIVMPGINKNVRTSAATSGSGSHRRRRISSDSNNSSSIDADIFQKLFHGKFSDDDELPSKGSSKGKVRLPPLSPSSSDESNDALEALFNRKANPIIQSHKRRDRFESLDSIDDLSEALMRSTPRDEARLKQSFSKKRTNSTGSNNKTNVTAKSTSSLSAKSSTSVQQGKLERSLDKLKSGPTNGNASGKSKAVTIIKPIKSDQAPNKHEPKTDPLNLREYIEESDSDSSYEYESDFYDDEEEDDISNAIIDLSTDTSRTNSVAETVTPVVSEDDDSAADGVDQEEQDQPTATEAQPPQLSSKCGDNELLQYYLNNLSKAETPPIYKKLTTARKGRSSEKKSPSCSLEQVKHVKHCESAANNDATGSVEDIERASTAPSLSERNTENSYNINDSLTLESVERISLDLAEQILQIDNERTIEYERHSGSKGCSSVRSRSNVSDDHPSTSNSKSFTMANHHVRKLTYSNDQLDQCVPSETKELRRTKSESAFVKRRSKGRLKQKTQKRAVTMDQNYSLEETTVSVPIGTEVKRKRGRPRKVTPSEIEKSIETELDLTKDNKDIGKKNIPIESSATVVQISKPLSTLETHAQIETGNVEPIVDINKDDNNALIEKSINAQDIQLSTKDHSMDVDATKENQQSHDGKLIEDAKLLPDDVSRDLKATGKEAHDPIAYRRALRSDDRKTAPNSHEEQSTPLKGYESRSSRRIPKGELSSLIDDQSLSIRNRRKNDSSTASTPSEIEREKSPVEKQPRSTQKRSKEKHLIGGNLRQKGDGKDIAISQLSPFKERITRSSKKEVPLFELLPLADSIPEIEERTRSSDRSTRRERNTPLPEAATKSHKEIKEKSTESSLFNAEINSQTDTKTEFEISQETDLTEMENEKSVELELVHDKSTLEGYVNPKTELTKSDAVKEMTDENISKSTILNSDRLQSTNDFKINQIKQRTEKLLPEDANSESINIESIQSDLDQQIGSKLLHETKTTNPNTEQNAEPLKTNPETIVGTADMNPEEKKSEPKNDGNWSEEVVAESEPQPVDDKTKIKTNKKKVISTPVKTPAERKKSKPKKEKTASVESVEMEKELNVESVEMEKELNVESVEMEKELNVEPIELGKQQNQDNSKEVCNKEIVIQPEPSEVISQQVEMAILSVQKNNEVLNQMDQKVEAIQLSEESNLNLVSKNTSETNQHDSVPKEVEEVECVQNEILSHHLEPHAETTTRDKKNIEIEAKTDVVMKLSEHKTDETKTVIESFEETTGSQTTEQTIDPGKILNDIVEKEIPVAPESALINETVSEDAKAADDVDKAVDMNTNTEPIIEKCNESVVGWTEPVEPDTGTTTASNDANKPKESIALGKPLKNTKKNQRVFKKRKVVFGIKKKKKYKENIIDTVEPFQTTIPITETVQVTQPFNSQEIEIYKSSASTSSTTVSPTSGSCRKLRVLVKRTPTSAETLKAERKSFVVGKMSNRFANKLACIAESTVQKNALEQNEIADKLQTKDQAQPVECADTDASNLNEQSIGESSSVLADINHTPSDSGNTISDCSPTRGSEITSTETIGVTLDEESSQLDGAAKRKKEEQQKADLELSMKKSGRRRKQQHEEQPVKKRSKIDFEAQPTEKGHFASISNKKTVVSGFQETKKIDTRASSTKKPLIQTLIRPDVSVEKTDDSKISTDLDKSLNSQRVTAEESFGAKESNYITVFTKKSASVKAQPAQETKTTEIGASPRKVNISVTVLPAIDIKTESHNVSVDSASQEGKNIDASATVNKKRKFISKKTQIVSKLELDSSEKKLLTHLVKNKKSDPRKSEAKAGPGTPHTKPLPQVEQGSKLVEINKIIPSDKELLPQFESEVGKKYSSATKKSIQQEERRKKLYSRKSEGAKARKVANPPFNVVIRKSLPFARLSQKLSKNKSYVGGTKLTDGEAGEKETTESQNHSKSPQNRRSEVTNVQTGTRKSSNDNMTKLPAAESASSSRDASKERLLREVDGKVGKVLGKTSVSPFMTRSSSSTRSSASTPVSVSLQNHRKAKNNTAGFNLEGGKIEVRELPVVPGLSSRRSRKDRDAPMLELVNHGYNRKRRLPGLTTDKINAKRVKQQVQEEEKVQEQKISTEEATQDTRQKNTEEHQGEEQLEESQLEESQLEEVQREEMEHRSMEQDELEPMEMHQQAEVQKQQVQEMDDMPKRDQRLHEEHSLPTNVAFPVMITAAATQSSMPTPTPLSKDPVMDPPITLVKEVNAPNSRHCRVRVNRRVVRKWVTEHVQTQPKEKEKSLNESEGKQKEATAPHVPDVPQIHISAGEINQVQQPEQRLPEKKQLQSLPVPIPVDEEVKSEEEEEVPVVVPASQTGINFPQHIATPAVPTPQLVRFNAPTTSTASNQNNSAASAAGQPPFGSTKMFSFLYPMRYQQTYGAVGLDFCCPNLDGPMRAIDPTRLHDKVEVPVLELPQYMVISTKFISKQDKNIPNKVRAKMAEMAKDGKPIQIGTNASDPVSTLTTDPSVAPTVPGCTLLTLAQNPVPDVHSIDALSKQLPRGTTLTKKMLPPGNILPLPTGTQAAPPMEPRMSIQLPPICPGDKQRMELQSRVQLFDLVLQELSRRATMMTVAERQKTIEEIVKTSTLLPIDVDVGTKLLENYVHYLNRATNSQPQMPSYDLNPMATPTTSISSTTKAQTPVSNSVLAKTTPTPLPSVKKPQFGNTMPTSTPLYDGDRNIIGYQFPVPRGATKNLSLANSSPVLAARLTQDQRVSTKSTDKMAASRTNNTMALRKVCSKSVPSQSAWVPGEGEPTIRSIKHVGSGTMISFNKTSTPKAPALKPRLMTTNPAIGKISDALSTKATTTPVPISIPAAPNITSTNVFVVNQLSSQPEECILPDVTNTVPLETEIKGEVEDVVEITP